MRLALRLGHSSDSRRTSFPTDVTDRTDTDTPFRVSMSMSASVGAGPQEGLR